MATGSRFANDGSAGAFMQQTVSWMQRAARWSETGMLRFRRARAARRQRSAGMMDLHVSLVGRTDLNGEIYRQLRQAILAGRLRPGERIPSSRELAFRLGVSRTSVAVAFERLAAEGFVTGRTGAGTFVCASTVDTREVPRDRARGALRPRPVWDSISLSSAFAAPAVFDFRTGLPDAALFPHHDWRRMLARTRRSETGIYGDPAGNRELREAIIRHLAISRGVEASADDVTITNGAQQGLDLVAKVLLSPGDRVAVEDPGYVAPRNVFSALGIRWTGVPVDLDGLVVEQLPHRARLVYGTPSHQYPLAVAMAQFRRLALLAWAEKNNAAILEDDYDSEF